MTLDELVPILAALPPGRQLIAVAGPPASGKSTLAEALSDRLNDAGRNSMVVPMDGFHMDNAELDALGLRARKGAPMTFSVKAFVECIKALKTGTRQRVPLFDRTLDAVVPDAQVVPEEVELLVVEGNYLLLDDPGWRDLHPLWDVTVSLDVSVEELEKRLMDRWRSHGYDEAKAREKTHANDLPNGAYVLENSIEAQFQLAGSADQS